MKKLYWLYLTIKYLAQGDDLKTAKHYAFVIVYGFRKSGV